MGFFQRPNGYIFLPKTWSPYKEDPSSGTHFEKHPLREIGEISERSLEFWQEWASVTIASKPDLLRLSIALCTQWRTGLRQPERITTNTALGYVVRRSQPAGSMCYCAVLASFNWPLSDAAGTVGILILAMPLACRQEKTAPRLCFNTQSPQCFLCWGSSLEPSWRCRAIRKLALDRP